MQDLEDNLLIVGASSAWKHTAINPGKSKVVRVNNFFFEDKYYFGKKIDFLVYGGDKYLANMYVKTLKKSILMNDYEVNSIVLANYSLIVRLIFRFHGFKVDVAASKFLSNEASNQTSGIKSLLLAKYFALSKIHIACIDQYSTTPYPFPLTGIADSVLHKDKVGYATGYHSRISDSILLKSCNLIDVTGKIEMHPSDVNFLITNWTTSWLDFLLFGIRFFIKKIKKLK